MTDITDQDRILARTWAEGFMSEPAVRGSRATAAARVILATVDAPEPTLAEAIEAWAEKHYSGVVGTGKHELLALADRAKQMEHERDDTRAELERVRDAVDPEGAGLPPGMTISEAVQTLVDGIPTGEHDGLTAEQWKREYDFARAEVERITAERDRLEAAQHISDGSAWGGPVREPCAERQDETVTAPSVHNNDASVQCSEDSVTDPADVKPGEAWAANIWYDDERHPGTAIKTPGGDWTVCRADGTRSTYRMNEYIDLIAPLVPEVDMTHILTEAAHDIATTFAETLGLPAAPRVITNPDELDTLATRAVIIGTDGQADVYQKDSNGEWLDVTGHGYPSRQVIRMENAVTVLWEPEA